MIARLTRACTALCGMIAMSVTLFAVPAASAQLLTGACCMPNGVCIMTNEIECTRLQGTYRGNGTSCNTVNICAPRGACCFTANGVIRCETTTQANCTTLGGTYRGNGTLCATTVCAPPPPTGACCVTSPLGITCQVTTEAACATAGGTYRGNGTVCGNDICAPRGACCVTTPNGTTCQILTAA